METGAMYRIVCPDFVTKIREIVLKALLNFVD
jgi:hypothetical protein